MKYSETEVMETMRRLSRIYLESYPEDKEGLERFIKWMHTQYGYEYEEA